MLKRSPAQRNFLVAASRPGGRAFACLRPGPARGDRRAPPSIWSFRATTTMPSCSRGLHEREPLPCRTFLPAAKTIELCQDKYALNVRFRDHRRSGGDDLSGERPRFPQRSVARAGAARTGLVPDSPRRASRGATKVRDADQAWHWISYWHTMRGVPVEHFTLCEFLPGRDLQRSGNLVRRPPRV